MEDYQEINNVLFEKNRFAQNRKVLRYRGSLAQLAVVCVNLKSLHGHLLSGRFCEFFQNNIKTLTELRDIFRNEIIDQEKWGWINQRNKATAAFGYGSHMLLYQKSSSLRSRLLSVIYFFCDSILNNLHSLNYAYLSDKCYLSLERLNDLCTILREEISLEREVQTQCRGDQTLKKAS